MSTSPDSLTLTFSLTEGDLIPLAKDVYATNPAMTSEKNANPAGCMLGGLALVLGLTVIYGCLGSPGPRNIVEASPALLLLVLACVLAIVIGLVIWGLRRTDGGNGQTEDVTRWTRLAMRYHLPGVRTVTFTADRVTLESELETRVLHWPVVAEAWTYPSGILLVTTRGYAEVIVPSSALTPEMRTTLHDYIAKCIAANRQSDRERIIKHMQGNAVRCPKCAYDLRGNTNAVCSECGEEIRPEHVRDAFPERYRWNGGQR